MQCVFRFVMDSNKNYAKKITGLMQKSRKSSLNKNCVTLLCLEQDSNLCPPWRIRAHERKIKNSNLSIGV